MKQTTLFLISLFTFVLAFFLTTEKSENISLTKKTSGAMQALEFWNRSRAFPNKDIPEAGYADALLYSKRNLRSLSERKFSSEEWRSIGPTNFGGRTLVLAINPQNPNTIYAGSASGGLWRTKSAGVGATAWSYVPVKNSSGDYFAVLGVGAVALAPNDTNTLLIGTGEVYGYQKSFGGFGLRTTRGSYGIGILKSIDNGATWTHTLDWSRNQRRGVQDIAFNPNNANIVYAATSEGTYKSADKGNSWTLIHAVEMVTDILIHPVNSETLFVSCGNLGSVNSGVYRSFDGGQTFTRLNGLPPFSGKTLLSFYGASPNVLYADVADSVSGKGLYRSTNLGDTWTSLNTENYASYQGWFSHFAVVHPGDSSKVLCAGVDVFKSTNGGRTLTQKSYWYNWFLDTTLAPGEPEGPSDYSHADHHAYAVHPTNPNIVYLANDGGVFVTTDFGETFSGRNGGYHTQQFYNGTSSSITDSFHCIGGLQDNAFVVSVPSTWSNGSWYRTYGGDGTWTAIDQKNDAHLYASTQNLAIVQSDNRGRGDWFYVFGGVSNIVNFCAPFVLSPYWSDTVSLERSRVLFAGEDRISKSTDGGNSWTQVNGNLPLDGNAVLSLAVSSNKPDTVFAGTLPTVKRAGLFRTTNGGTSWDSVYRWGPDSLRVFLPNRYPMDIALDEQNPKRAYVVFSGFDTSRVYRTSDGGRTWIDCTRWTDSSGQMDSLPNVPTNAIAIDPLTKNIYLGNDLGVYVADSNGTRWNEFTDGMPPAIVMDLNISRSNRMLRAFTHGIGVYERRLLDTTLTPVTDVKESFSSPISFSLEQNYPNPFNPVTVIRYSLSVNSVVTLKVYDVLGKEVATLIHSRLVDEGKHEIEFDGSRVASGIYYYKLTVGKFSEMKKMALLK